MPVETISEKQLIKEFSALIKDIRKHFGKISFFILDREDEYQNASVHDADTGSMIADFILKYKGNTVVYKAAKIEPSRFKPKIFPGYESNMLLRYAA